MKTIKLLTRQWYFMGGVACVGGNTGVEIATPGSTKKHYTSSGWKSGSTNWWFAPGSGIIYLSSKVADDSFPSSVQIPQPQSLESEWIGSMWRPVSATGWFQSKEGTAYSGDRQFRDGQWDEEIPAPPEGEYNWTEGSWKKILKRDWRGFATVVMSRMDFLGYVSQCKMASVVGEQKAAMGITLHSQMTVVTTQDEVNTALVIGLWNGLVNQVLSPVGKVDFAAWNAVAEQMELGVAWDSETGMMAET